MLYKQNESDDLLEWHIVAADELHSLRLRLVVGYQKRNYEWKLRAGIEWPLRGLPTNTATGEERASVAFHKYTHWTSSTRTDIETHKTQATLAVPSTDPVKARMPKKVPQQPLWRSRFRCLLVTFSLLAWLLARAHPMRTLWPDNSISKYILSSIQFTFYNIIKFNNF